MYRLCIAPATAGWATCGFRVLAAHIEHYFDAMDSLHALYVQQAHTSQTDKLIPGSLMPLLLSICKNTHVHAVRQLHGYAIKDSFATAASSEQTIQSATLLYACGLSRPRRHIRQSETLHRAGPAQCPVRAFRTHLKDVLQGLRHKARMLRCALQQYIMAVLSVNTAACVVMANAWMA